jgi:2'-5' RNA ligase
VESAAVALPMTGIVVPVREAETVVRSRALQVQPALLPRDRSTAAHITLLAPFRAPDLIDDGVIRHLQSLFAEIASFTFELTEVCEFPSGITYLAPEPAATFRWLTQQLHHAFPEFPPYGGAFDDIVPHLTVPLAPGEDSDSLRATLTAGLPIQAHALEATLVQVAEDDTRVLATLPFGNSAA